MANETERVAASQVTIIDPASVTSVADAQFSAETNDNPLTDTNTAGYPLVDFVLYATAASAFDAEGTVRLYVQMKNIQSTNDAPTPDSTYPHEYVGSFILDAATSLYIPLRNVTCPLLDGTKEAHYQVENLGGQTLATNGWGLYATAHGIVPGS